MHIQITKESEFFRNIDTKDKAYWLGLLYADGCVEKRRVGFSFSSHDEWFLEKVIRTFTNYEKIQINGLYRIRFSSTRMASNLILHGCVPCKSKIIELPTLDSREIYLAFLLGFFDGDGTQKSTRITCGSRKFLEQIKEMFHLPFKIIERNSNSYIYHDRKIVGKGYDIHLGSELFNEMMENYTDSLPRKRNHFCTKEEKGRRAADASRSFDGKEKLVITKEDLERRVHEKPSRDVAHDLGVSDKTICNKCKKLGIEKPGRGYWAKQRAGASPSGSGAGLISQ